MSLIQPISTAPSRLAPAFLMRLSAEDFDARNPSYCGLGQTLSMDKPISVFASDTETALALSDWAQAQDGFVVVHATLRKAVEAVASNPEIWSALFVAPSEEGQFDGSDCDLEIFFDLLGLLPIVKIDPA